MTATPPPPAASCLRCQAPVRAPFGKSPLCPRCASEHLLAMTLEVAGPSTPPFGPTSQERIGPYLIISEIGRGGMGTVYLAQHQQLGNIIALKAIPSTGSASSDLEMRFLREARTTARLRHPHIVTVHDAGRTASHAYFAMDYIENGDVAQRLRQQRQFAPDFAARLLHPVAAAIAYSHEQGVLHRDLKPSNILLQANEPRVADFGLAAQLETGGDLTATHTQLGTPHYLAPEVFNRTSEPGVASDIYALGVILYEMVTGRTPFAGSSPAALAALVTTVDPPDLRLLAPHAPRDLETICRHCLEIEPDRRYATAAALAEDLRRFLADEPLIARPVSQLTQAWRWARRRPQLAALWVISFALALGASATAVGLNRARLANIVEIRRTAQALDAARTAETLARDRLRAGKLAEARALRRTSASGRSTAALAALAEAAEIRPGLDLQTEAIAALLLPEFQIDATWPLQPAVPIAAMVDPTGRIALVEELTLQGAPRGAISLRRWGEDRSYADLTAEGTSLAGIAHFNAAGTLLGTRYQDESLRVWATADGTVQLLLPHLPLAAPDSENHLRNDDFDFTADGQTLCVGDADGGLRWLRLSDGSPLAQSPSPTRFTTVRCAPVGERVAACSISLSASGSHDLVVYAHPGSPPEYRFPLASIPVAIAWSPDARLLVVAQTDQSVITFDVPSGRILHAVSSPTMAPRALVVLAGGRFATITGVSSAVRVLDLGTGEEVCDLGETGPAPISRDASGSVFFVTSPSGTQRRWGWREAVGLRHFDLPQTTGYEYSGDAGGLDFNDRGDWAATAHGRYAVIRNIGDGALLGELDGGDSAVLQFSSVLFHPDGTSLLRSSTANGLQRYELSVSATGGLTFGEPEAVDAEPGFLIADHTRDRRRLVLLNRVSGDVKVLDLDSTGRAQTTSRWQSFGVNHASISPDGAFVLVNCTGIGSRASAMHLSVHRATDGALIASPPAPVSCDTAWSEDGATALTSDGQTESVIWNTHNWTPRVKLAEGLGGNTTTFTLAPTGNRAVICQNNTVQIVATTTGIAQQVLHLPHGQGIASNVRFLPDRRRFAVLWPDGSLDVIDPTTITNFLRANHIR